MPELNRLFVGRLSEKLSDLIEQQSAAVFDRAGLTVPVRSCSLLIAIGAQGPTSVSGLAQALDRSHQVIQQKIPKLIKLGLVTRRPHPEDNRAMLIEITSEGRDQLALFESLAPHFERAYAELEDEAGFVFATIARAIDSLEQRPLTARIPVGEAQP